MLKDLKENMNIMRREMEGVRGKQMGLKVVKTTISELKDSLAKPNSKLDIAEEKISEFEDMAIESIQNEIEKKKLMDRLLMSCGTTPRVVTLCVIGVPKGGGEPENI